jgi:hypothetical protein
MEEKVNPPEFFKSVKTSMKSILKHPEINITKINDVVIKAHKIVIHTLQFLKLYLMHHYETNHQTLPILMKETPKNMRIKYGTSFFAPNENYLPRPVIHSIT